MAIYYVKNGGNNSNSGLSDALAWADLTKVNSFWAAFSFSPGDSILFKCGDTFYGTLTLVEGGTSGNPITIGSYGTGILPVITGFTTISSWTNEGSGIYSKVITSDMQTNMVTIDDVNTPMGRFPESTYLTYESFVTTTSITDTSLTGTPSRIGTEVVIEKNSYTWDRCIVTNHVTNTLTYTSHGSSFSGTNGFRYFFQNALACVTKYGDWYHDYAGTGKFYMYFGAVDPTTKTVKVSTKTSIIKADAIPYINITNIVVTGAIESVVKFRFNCISTRITNSTFLYSGSEGISLSSVGGFIDNNTVKTCGTVGIMPFSTGMTVTNNFLNDIATLVGQSNSIGGNWPQLGSIVLMQDTPTVQYNKITNSGYSGIMCYGSLMTGIISNNYIKTACILVSDMGGIYIYSTRTAVSITDNIIDGINGHCVGIYMDEVCTNVTVRRNTIMNCVNDPGIKLHKAHNNILEDNVCFNNSVGLDIENWTGSAYISNITLNRNIFCALNTQLAMYFLTTYNEIPTFGTADNNYYIRPIDDNTPIRLRQPSIGDVYRTLIQWKTFTSQDINSHGSPISIDSDSKIHIIYNETKVSRTFRPTATLVGVDNVAHSDAIVLSPFTSMILIGSGSALEFMLSTYSFTLASQ